MNTYKVRGKSNMKRLVDLVKIVENNRDCVILEVVGSSLDMIRLGCFDGNETMMRLTKGRDHTCTVWKNDSKSYDWYWGHSGYTLVTDKLDQQGRLIQDCITRDFEIYIDENKDLIENTLYIKSLEDIKHNTHNLKLMYWEHSKDQVCCHLDGAFHTYFKGVECGIKHFTDKGYNVELTNTYIAPTGCIVKVYHIVR